jgi:hypothetical protein
MQAERGVAGLLQFTLHRGGGLRVAVEHGNSRATAGKTQRKLASEAASAAADDDRGVPEPAPDHAASVPSLCARQ